MISPKKNVQAMSRYDPPLEGRRDKLRLDFNENTRGPSPRVLEVLGSLTPEIISTYPEYDDAYDYFAKSFALDRSRLLACNGTDEAIRIIFNTYIGEGDTIVLPTPTYALFGIESTLAGAEIKEVFYNKDLSFPSSEVIAASEGARMVVMVNPNNPTGTAVENDTIREVAKRAEIVLVDEAYYEFNQRTALSLLDKYDNIIVTRTFSKVYGLAGLRLGLVMAHPSTISTLRKVASPYSVNSLSLLCAKATLEDMDYINAYIKEVMASRTQLIEGIRALGITAYDSRANFVVCRFGDNAKIIDEELRKRGILVRDRSSYPLLEGCLRIGVGTPQQTRTVLSAIEDILEVL